MNGSTPTVRRSSNSLLPGHSRPQWARVVPFISESIIVSVTNQPAPSASRIGLSGKRVALSNPDLVRAIILLALLVAGSLLTPNYLSASNLRVLLLSVAGVGIVAYGMTMVVISGEIDLSVAGAAALSCVVGATFLDSGSAFLVIGATLATGLAIGLINGVLTTALGIPSLIATLAMLSIARALANILSQGQASYPDKVPAYLWFGSGQFLGIATPIALLFLIGAAALILTKYTTFGAALYATGSNIRAAALSGIPVHRVKIAVFMLAGLFAAIGGMIESARLSYINPASFAGLELEALAITVLGGAALAGGSGTVVGTLLAAMIIGVLNNLLNQLGVSLYMQQVVTGLVILAVVLPGYAKRQFVK